MKASCSRTRRKWSIVFIILINFLFFCCNNIPPVSCNLTFSNISSNISLPSIPRQTSPIPPVHASPILPPAQVKEWSLMIEAASAFPSTTNLRSQGYSVFTQHSQSSALKINSTSYTLDKDIKIRYESAPSDFGQRVIVLSDAVLDDLDDEVVHNSSLVLIRCPECGKNKYTGHLAYMRKSKGIEGPEVEWDTLNSLEGSTELDFLAAFTPSDYELEISFRPVPKNGNGSVVVSGMANAKKLGRAMEAGGSNPYKIDCSKHKDMNYNPVPGTKCLKYFKCVKKMGNWTPAVLSCADGEHWHRERKLCIPIDMKLDPNTCDDSNDGGIDTTSMPTTPDDGLKETTLPPDDGTSSSTTESSELPIDCTLYKDGKYRPVPGSKCLKYFKCVKKSGKFEPKILECSSGTHFHAGKKECIPKKTNLDPDTCLPGSGNPTTLLPPDTEDTVSPLTPETTTETMTSTTVDPPEFNPDCKKYKDGVFRPVPGSQCLKYFKCIKKYGKYEPKILICKEDSHFHAEKKICVPIEEELDYDTCLPGSSTSETTVSETTTPEMTTSETTPTTSSASPTSDPPEFNPDCKKYKDGVFRPVSGSQCLKYFKCIKKYGKYEPKILICKDDSHFHAEKKICVPIEEELDYETCLPGSETVSPSTSETTVSETTTPEMSTSQTTPTTSSASTTSDPPEFNPDCKKYKDGVFRPVPGSQCLQYFKCIKKYGKYEPKIFTCKEGSHFHAEKKICVPIDDEPLDPSTCLDESTPSSTISTPTITFEPTTPSSPPFDPDCKKYSDGVFRPVPNTQCLQYFKCVKKSGKYKAVVKECAEGSQFHADLKICVPITEEDPLDPNTCKSESDVISTTPEEDDQTEDPSSGSYEHYVEPRSVYGGEYDLLGFDTDVPTEQIFSPPTNRNRRNVNLTIAITTEVPPSQQQSPLSQLPKSKTSTTTVPPTIRDSFLNSSDKFPYIGILNCPWEGKDVTLFTGKSPINIAVNFFLHTLRAQCHISIMTNTIRLFQREIVTMDAGNTTHFRLNLKSKLINQVVLNPLQKRDFLSAIFLVAYSQAFTKHLSQKSPSPSVTPSVATLTTMINKIVGLLRVKQFERHALKIMLAVTSTLRDWIRRLTLESEWLKRHCQKRAKCSRLKKLNRKSLRHLETMLEQLYRISF